MVENALSCDDIMAKYKKFVPAKYVRQHSMFIKGRVEKNLKNLAKKDIDSKYDTFDFRECMVNFFISFVYIYSFLKSTVLDAVNSMAPDYLVEQCSAIDQNPPDADRRQNGATCNVQLTFDPYHKQTPGLMVKYPLQDQSVHVSRLDDIFAIIIRGDTVQFEIRNKSAGFNIIFPTKRDRESFLSGICGYYR